MSLRDKNLGLVTTGNNTGGLCGSLRTAATGIVKKPDGTALNVIRKAVATCSLPGNGRVGFVIDATGSRQSNWVEAQSIQKRMFEKISGQGRMTMRLVHFSGAGLKDLGWQTSADDILCAMSQVSCVSGSTQILQSLERFLSDAPAETARSIIVVGDSFEEDDEAIAPLAEKLKAKGIKVFAFLDGGCSTAKEAFETLAKITGGAFAQFGADMPLEDLCQGVALYSVGGATALARLENAAARQLLLGGPK